MAFEELSYSVNLLFENMETFFQALLGVPTYGKAKDYVLHHPFVAAAVLTVAFLSAVPMMFFLGFIITTLAVALLCFFCIEGSLIAISGLIFIGVVSFIAIIVGSILSGMAFFAWILQKFGICLKPCTFVCQNSTNQNEENHQNNQEDNSNHSE